MVIDLIHSLDGVDQQLLLWINGHGNQFFDSFMTLFTGKAIWIPMYISTIYVMARNYSWRTVLLFVIGVTLTIAFCDQICSSVIRPIVARPRPSAPGSPIADLVHIVSRRAHSNGFPSCHAANTFALAFFMMYLMRRRVLNICLFAWAAMSCYTRMYLALHYPGDILCGFVIGFVGATIFYHLTKLFVKEQLPAARFTDATVWVTAITTLYIVVLSLI